MQHAWQRQWRGREPEGAHSWAASLPARAKPAMGLPQPLQKREVLPSCALVLTSFLEGRSDARQSLFSPWPSALCSQAQSALAQAALRKR